MADEINDEEAQRILARLDTIPTLSHPDASNAALTPEERIGRIASSHVRAGSTWQTAAPAIFRHFPGTNPEFARNLYNSAQTEADLNRERQQQATQEESVPEYIGRRAIPFASPIYETYRTISYQRARDRYQQGTATPDDLKTMAHFERLQEIDKDRTVGEGILSGLTHAPAFVLEARAAGPVGLQARAALSAAPRAAAFLGGLAARTAVTPTTWLPQLAERNLENNRTGFSRIADLPAAFTMGMAQNAVIGSVSQYLGEGTLSARRVATATLVGLGEQHGLLEPGAAGLDALVGPLAGAINKELPATLRLQTGHGLIHNFIRGDNEAWKQLAVSTATFAVFSTLHGLQGGAKEVKNTTEAAMKDLATKGVPSERVPEKLLEIQAKLHEPGAREVIENLPEGPMKEFALAQLQVIEAVRGEQGYQQPAQGPTPGLESMPEGKPIQGYQGLPPQVALAPVTSEVQAQRAAAAQPASEGFTTAHGSTYVVHENGTTTRTKAARVGHDDFGLKRQSDKTVYANPDIVAALSAAGMEGIADTRVVIHGDKATLMTKNHKGQWGSSESGRNVPISHVPQNGLAPLELWKRADFHGREAYQDMHAGSAITVLHANAPPTIEPAAQPAAEPTSRPKPTSEQKAESMWEGATGNGRRVFLGGDPNRGVAVPGGEPASIARVKWSDLAPEQQARAMQQMGLTPTPAAAPATTTIPPPPPNPPGSGLSDSGWAKRWVERWASFTPRQKEFWLRSSKPTSPAQPAEPPQPVRPAPQPAPAVPPGPPGFPKENLLVKPLADPKVKKLTLADQQRREVEANAKYLELIQRSQESERLKAKAAGREEGKVVRGANEKIRGLKGPDFELPDHLVEALNGSDLPEFSRESFKYYLRGAGGRWIADVVGGGHDIHTERKIPKRVLNYLYEAYPRLAEAIEDFRLQKSAEIDAAANALRAHQEARAPKTEAEAHEQYMDDLEALKQEMSQHRTKESTREESKTQEQSYIEDALDDAIDRAAKAAKTTKQDIIKEYVNDLEGDYSGYGRRLSGNTRKPPSVRPEAESTLPAGASAHENPVAGEGGTGLRPAEAGQGPAEGGRGFSSANQSTDPFASAKRRQAGGDLVSEANAAGKKAHERAQKVNAPQRTPDWKEPKDLLEAAKRHAHSAETARIQAEMYDPQFYEPEYIKRYTDLADLHEEAAQKYFEAHQAEIGNELQKEWQGGSPEEQEMLLELLKEQGRLGNQDALEAARKLNAPTRQETDDALSAAHQKELANAKAEASEFHSASKVEEAIQRGEEAGKEEGAAQFAAERASAEAGEEPHPEPAAAAEHRTGEPSPRERTIAERVAELVDLFGPDFGQPLTPAEQRNFPGGGSGVGEAPLRTTGLAKEVFNGERRKAELDEIVKQASQSDPELWAKANAMNHDQVNQIVDEVSKTPRPLKAEESLAVLRRRVELRNELERTVSEFVEASNDKAKKDAIEQRYNKINEMIDVTDTVADRIGSEAGRTLRVHQLLAANDFTLAGLIRRGLAANKGKLSEADIGEIKTLSDKIASLEKELASARTKVAGAGEEGRGPVTEAWTRKKTEAADARISANIKIEKLTWDNLSKGQKALELWRRFRLFQLISGPITALKVATSSTLQPFAFSAYEAIGSIIKNVPGVGRIAAGAPIEGKGFNPAAEKAALFSTKQGIKDGVETMRKGYSGLDAANGNAREMSLPLHWSWLDLPGRLHAAEKAQAVRNLYERTKQNLMESYKKAGKDLNNPDIQDEIGKIAYDHSRQAKFQQDAVVVDKFNRFVRELKRPENNAGAQAVGHIIDTLLPIRRTPYNIVVSALEHVLGVPLGAARTALALRAGEQAVTPQQKDSIMRQLKRGSLGLALLATGYALSGSLGGMYSGKRKEGELKPGEIDSPLGKIPAWVSAHHPAMMALHLGAAWRREEAKTKRGEQPSTTAAGFHALGSLMEEIPYIREMNEGHQLFRGNERSLGSLAKSLTVPAFLNWIAENTDGDVPRRYPQTIGQHIETGIPGLRQEVRATPARR